MRLGERRLGISLAAMLAVALGAGTGAGPAEAHAAAAPVPGQVAAAKAKKPKHTTLHIKAIDGIKYNVKRLRAKPGKVTIIMKNTSPLQHDVALKHGGLKKPIRGKIVPKGGTSKVSATLKKGTYEFYCTVPGHEQAGMKGTLIIK
jgi:uncharacterized cupredoxin-like copper-binding protein